MAVLLYTNRGKTIQHPFWDVTHVPGERIVVAAGANNDVAYLPGKIFWRKGFNVGPTFQSQVANMNVKLTQFDEKYAMDSRGLSPGPPEK